LQRGNNDFLFGHAPSLGFAFLYSAATQGYQKRHGKAQAFLSYLGGVGALARAFLRLLGGWRSLNEAADVGFHYRTLFDF